MFRNVRGELTEHIGEMDWHNITLRMQNADFYIEIVDIKLDARTTRSLRILSIFKKWIKFPGCKRRNLLQIISSSQRQMEFLFASW